MHSRWYRLLFRRRTRCRVYCASGRLLAATVAAMLVSCNGGDPPTTADSTASSGNSASAKSGGKTDESSGGSVTRTAEGGPRLIILYATCTVNKNYLSPYNSEIAFTPHLDAFARKSVVFDRHQTEAGQSGIAYASIFTGKQADQHGVYYHPTRLDDNLYLISEAFSDAGYETFFWSGHGMAASDLNYGQGVREKNVSLNMLSADDEQFQKILERLKQDPDYKAFVLTNFSVTHSHYAFDQTALPTFLEKYPDELGDLPQDQFENYGRLFLTNVFPLSLDFPKVVEANQLNQADVAKLSHTIDVMYRACVHRLDKLFGAVVSEVEDRNLTDDSLIVFTADHGELLYRENALFPWTHGFQLAPEVLNVPLMLCGDELKPGRFEGVTRSIDVFPTLAGLCNFEVDHDQGIAGVDLTSRLRSETAAGHDDLLAYSHTSIRIRALKENTGRFFDRFYPTIDPELIWVCIRDNDTVYKWRNLDGTNWGHQVFDLATDPQETSNLFDETNRKHREFAQRLTDYKARLTNAHRPSPLPGSAQDQFRLRQRLRALGYIE